MIHGVDRDERVSLQLQNLIVQIVTRLWTTRQEEAQFPLRASLACSWGTAERVIGRRVRVIGHVGTRGSRRIVMDDGAATGREPRIPDGTEGRSTNENSKGISNRLFPSVGKQNDATMPDVARDLTLRSQCLPRVKYD